MNLKMSMMMTFTIAVWNPYATDQTLELDRYLIELMKFGVLSRKSIYKLFILSYGDSMTIVKEFKALNLKIQKKFAPLSWVDITHFDNGTGSITFTDCGEDADEFFSKMRDVKDFIKGFGYNASLTKFETDKLCPYNEARIDINFEGGELE